MNHLPLLQNLIDLDVDLLKVYILIKNIYFKIDTNTNIGRALVRLNWERDLYPKINWLVKEVGVDVNVLGDYLTRNPFFLIQKMQDLNVKVK